MLRNILIAALILGISASAFAQPDKGNPQKHKMKAELRTWFETSVYPSLKKWHDQYDASLSSEDLATLTQLRAEAKAMKQKMHAEEKQDRDELKDDLHALIEQVKPIAKRSRETLRKIFDENEDQIDAWREELREKLQGMQGDGKHRGSGGPMNGMLDMDKRSALRFILWDGTMPAAREGFDETGPTMGSVNVAPNPADRSATVTMQDLPNGKATIEIFDMNGVKVNSQPVNITNGSLDERIDVSMLSAGTYMVSIVTPNGRRTTALSVPR